MMAATTSASHAVPQAAVVRRVRRDTADVVTLELELPDRPEGFPFAPGQFNMLYPFGAGEVPISISGDPARPQVLVHTVRAVGLATQAICRARKGSVLGVRGPFGAPWPVQALRGADVLVVAGGLGLAPLRPAIYHLLQHRADYGEVALLVGARTPADLLFGGELRAWRRRAQVQCLVTVDRAGPDWRDAVGVVPALVPLARFRPERTVALVCGPEVMMRFTVRELERRGIPDDRIHLSMERNMKCAVGHCGHCQLGPTFVCKDGPVLPYAQLRPVLLVREA